MNATKDKPPHYGHHPPYAAVCFFRRQAGRPDLESGGIRGNMLTRRGGFPPISDEWRKTLGLILKFYGKEKDFVPFQMGFVPSRLTAPKFCRYKK